MKKAFGLILTILIFFVTSCEDEDISPDFSIIANAGDDLEVLTGEEVILDGEEIVLNDNALISHADIHAVNGIVHVINAVLLPPVKLSGDFSEDLVLSAPFEYTATRC